MIVLPKLPTMLPRNMTRPTDYTKRYGPNKQFGAYIRRAGMNGGIDSAAWISVWKIWGTLITAGHCLTEIGGLTPNHPDSDKRRRLAAVPDLRSPDGQKISLDAAIGLDVKLPKDSPPKPLGINHETGEIQMRVEIWGHPAGCTGKPEKRTGWVYDAHLEGGNNSMLLHSTTIRNQ